MSFSFPTGQIWKKMSPMILTPKYGKPWGCVCMLRQKWNATQVMYSLEEFVLCTMQDLLSLDIYKPATFQNRQWKEWNVLLRLLRESQPVLFCKRGLFLLIFMIRIVVYGTKQDTSFDNTVGLFLCNMRIILKYS